MQQLKAATSAALYRAVWRWHFYAGLFVLPFILILSVTGSIYLFKPQIDRWEERAYRSLPADRAVSADSQVATALAAFPGARFNHYRLPERPSDAAVVQVGLADGSQREVFVSPQGRALGSLDPSKRISEVVALVHGSLLLGKVGDWMVELAASWTIVMILTGLYMWWPRPFAPAGTLWPRMSLKGRALLKDLHRVTGFWIAGLVLVMLASGLPWAGAWGGMLEQVRTELGWVEGPREWTAGAEANPFGHKHEAKPVPSVAPPVEAPAGLPLSAFVTKAQIEKMPFPVVIIPPHAPQRFGPPTGADWTIKSETQDRPQQRQVSYDPRTGAETGRSGFGDKHVIDRIVGTGIAWHEGQLFGLANQLLGVLTALALIALSMVGVLMWLNRRRSGTLGAPPAIAGASVRGPIVLLVALGLLLPLFGASLIALALVDRIAAMLRRHGKR